MHPCFHVDEIIRLTTCELAASGAKATAATFACCCKSFEGPALDALWETQDRLLPLLKSFPADVWNGDRCTVSAPTKPVHHPLNCLVLKSFRRPPTTLEWARFRKCALRMRELGEHDIPSVLSSEVASCLQLCAIDGTLFPNLNTVQLWNVTLDFVPFIPLFLTPKTTAIRIDFNATHLDRLPRDPRTTAAVSDMLLASNRNALQCFYVESPLTEEARKVIHKLPDLRELLVVIEKDDSLPSLMLPSLTDLTISYDHDSDWLQALHGATLNKLVAATFYSRSEQIGSFLEEFENIAPATSAETKLSKFRLYASRPWSPNYSSLLRFTHLSDLVIEFPCGDTCSSKVDDDVVTDLARAMPKLVILRLGDEPCRKPPTGVTIKGLVALAHYCSDLWNLRIHLRLARLRDPPAIWVPNPGPTAPMRDCALTELDVGKTQAPKGSTLALGVTLTRIFPRIERIRHTDKSWDEVAELIADCSNVIKHACKERSPSTLQRGVNDTFPGATL